MPHSLEAEGALLGSMIINTNIVVDVVSELPSEAFYNSEYKWIYTAIKHLADRNDAVDYVSILNEMKLLGSTVDRGMLINIGESVPSSANYKYYLNIVLEKYRLRSIINSMIAITEKAYEEENSNILLEKLDQYSFDLFKKNRKQTFRSFNEEYQSLLIELEERQKNPGLKGVSSGYPELDKLTNGWAKKDLIYIAGRPSMGKTGFMLNLAKNASLYFLEKYTASLLSEQNEKCKSVGVFSLEMSAQKLVERVAANIHDINSDVLKKGTLTESDWDQIARTNSNLYEVGSNIFIDDSGEVNIAQLRATARRLVKEKNCGIIFIDYMQLLSAKSESRFQEVSLISRKLKVIAKELEIPIIALSQLSRKNEDRRDKRPMLSDLRESGQLEQDGDIILFIHRAEYYGDEFFDDGSSTENVAEIIIAKNRDGALGTKRLTYMKEKNKFTTYSPRKTKLL